MAAQMSTKLSKLCSKYLFAKEVSVIEFSYLWGHLQTMWTVFWVFFTPPPPLWTNMDILGTPLPVHVDFSMTPPLYFQKNFQTTNLSEF